MTKNINDTQVSQLRSAINRVVLAGPDFLTQKVPPEKMAQTMVKAVEDYANKAKQSGTPQPKSDEARELHEVLGEIMECGSGFLACQCDAACVARTVTYLINEFPVMEKV